MTSVAAPRLPALAIALRRHLAAPRYRIEPPHVPKSRQLFVDVSVIIRADQRTGIQRVVRALLGQLPAMVDPLVTVQPVFASKDHGYCRAEFAADGTVRNAAADPRGRQPVVPQSGDVFLGLDLAAHLLPHLEADLARWRRGGVAINVMVYDLLPLLHPEWFPPRTGRNFARWLGVLARQSDRCIAISCDVAGTLAEVLPALGYGPSPEVATIPLGFDLSASYPSYGMPADIIDLQAWLGRHRVVLSVGTVEPRKGHQQLLAALDRHWRTNPGSDVALLLVGRAGWKNGALQVAIREHPEQGKRLLWLEEVSDELLAKLYGEVAGLVAASHGEGFGLPPIEAAAQGTPVLARDIPVFREIGGPLFDYFDNDAPEPLAERIEDWLAAPRRPAAEAVAALPRWTDSARALARCLGLAPAHTAKGAAR